MNFCEAEGQWAVWQWAEGGCRSAAAVGCWAVDLQNAVENYFHANITFYKKH